MLIHKITKSDSPTGPDPSVNLKSSINSPIHQNCIRDANNFRTHTPGEIDSLLQMESFIGRGRREDKTIPDSQDHSVSSRASRASIVHFADGIPLARRVPRIPRAVQRADKSASLRRCDAESQRRRYDVTVENKAVTRVGIGTVRSAALRARTRKRTRSVSSLRSASRMRSKRDLSAIWPAVFGSRRAAPELPLDRHVDDTRVNARYRYRSLSRGSARAIERADRPASRLSADFSSERDLCQRTTT